jgi:hypothetical protein
MKVKYTGEDERVFPTLGITAEPGQEFDAPSDFTAPGVVPSGKAIPAPTTPSAATDTTQGA